MKKLKIAFVCIYSHPSICGVWSRIYNLSKLLIEKGHSVHIFSTNTIKGTNNKSSPFEVYDKIKIHRTKPKLSLGENINFWSLSQLKKLNPDIIVAEVYRHPHTHTVLKIAKKLKKPCFLTTHAPFVEPELRSKTGNLIASFYDKFYGKKVINKFDEIITITKWEVPYLLKIGADKNKLVYLPNGLPDEFFTGKKEKGKNLLFLGRIARIKNLETMIKALGKLVKKHPSLKLKIVGPADEKYKEELLTLIKNLNLEKSIEFLPAIYDLKKKIKIIDSAEIFILPSKREAMPQSLIEAMSRGKIVIASKNKGTEELIINNQTGFLFPVLDSSNLAEILDSCLTKKNKKKLNEIRKNASRKAEEFKWKKIFNDFYKLLQKHTK
jgi:glycosyltransferase involved in cell wall biosynthesis